MQIMHKIKKSYLQYLPSNQRALFLLHLAGVQKRHFEWGFLNFYKSFFCIVVAMCDLVHDELSQLTSSANLLCNMSDVLRTANCNFPDITHILKRFPDDFSSKHSLC